jgi:hypothetical protein
VESTDPYAAEFKYNRYLSDAGTVNLFNVESIMQRFSMREGKGSAMHDIPSKPYFSYSKHETEGYAIDWSL